MTQDERIVVSPIGQSQQLQSYSRAEYYDEQFRRGERPRLSVHTVALLLFNPYGDILLQKRSFTKRHNAKQIDKTLGGHIVFGDNPDHTLMVETVQELLTPSIVLRSEEDFAKMYDLLKDYLSTVALVKHLDTAELLLKRMVNNETFNISSVMHTYVGIYDGSIKPADREASGMLYYSLEHLLAELDETPEVFTHDITVLLDRYGAELNRFLTRYAR